MNVIAAALRFNKSYETKLALYKAHGNQHQLAWKFEREGPTKANRHHLDRELQKLRWKKGLPKEVSTITEEGLFDVEQLPPPTVRPKRKPTPSRLPPQAEQESGETDRLYPRSIERAIAIRGKAINAREKAGRELTQFAESLSQEERAALMKEQKEQHEIVAAQTREINHWKKTGKVLKKGELTEQELLEKEWRSIKSQLSPFRKRAVEPGISEEERAKRVQRVRDMEARQEELRIILGKQKRPPRKKKYNV